MITFGRRLAAKLQAARRLLTGDRRLEDEPPDDQESVTTVPAAAVKIWHSSAAHDEPKEKEKLRRDLEDAAAQTNLMTATALHDALQAQVDSAAVTTLRTARAAAADDDSKHKKHDQQHTGSPTGIEFSRPCRHFQQVTDRFNPREFLGLTA